MAEVTQAEFQILSAALTLYYEWVMGEQSRLAMEVQNIATRNEPIMEMRLQSLKIDLEEKSCLIKDVVSLWNKLFVVQPAEDNSNAPVSEERK